MTRAALGWRSHSGWAVLVAAQGPESSPRVLARRRVELVDESLPRMAYHAILEDELSLRDGKALLARVRRVATVAALKAMKADAAELGVQAVGVVGKVRNIPDDLERILSSHALLHAAEGALYEEVLVDAASRTGLPAVLVVENTIEIGAALDSAGKTLGPPWQKDHKL